MEEGQKEKKMDKGEVIELKQRVKAIPGGGKGTMREKRRVGDKDENGVEGG